MWDVDSQTAEAKITPTPRPTPNTSRAEEKGYSLTTSCGLAII
jgi:hypothetical protein